METTDYTKEEIETIILFLHNDWIWYKKEQPNPTIASYLKKRIKYFQEEI